LLGGWWQYQREKRSFLYTGRFSGLSTLGMIVFLNFSNAEVRDRDYFFQSGFHAYSLWIALGAGAARGVGARVVRVRRPRSERGAGAGVLLAVQPFC
jgi:hypothetical protein